MIEEASAAIERRRIDLTMLQEYRNRLTECYTLEALIQVLVDRAEEINKSINASIERDQAVLDEMIKAEAVETTVRATDGH